VTTAMLDHWQAHQEK